MRYQIYPFRTADCDRLADTLLDEFDAETDAREMARSLAPDYTFGVGILDTSTYQVDAGKGFGVPWPAERE